MANEFDHEAMKEEYRRLTKRRRELQEAEATHFMPQILSAPTIEEALAIAGQMIDPVNQAFGVDAAQNERH